MNKMVVIQAKREETLEEKPMLLHKEFRKQESAYTRRAKREGKLICPTCMHQDFSRTNEGGERIGSLKKFEEYTESTNFTEVSSHYRERENNFTGQIIPSLFIDFKCPRNHGISLQLKKPQIEALTLEQKNKYKVGASAELYQVLKEKKK
jgi:hypothetical protein